MGRCWRGCEVAIVLVAVVVVRYGGVEILEISYRAISVGLLDDIVKALER